MDSIEVWKPIVGYEGFYEVSTLARVRSFYNGSSVIIKQYIFKNGYARVSLSKDGVRKHHYVHRLVAIAFLPNPNNYPCVLHKTESNPSINNVDNLKWGTYSENNIDMYNKGRGRNAKGSEAYITNLSGIKHPNTKQVLNTATGIYYTNTKEAANSANLNKGSLYGKLNGHRKNDTDFIYV